MKKVWTFEDAQKELTAQAVRFRHAALTWDGQVATCPKCKETGTTKLSPEKYHGEFLPPYFGPITYEYCGDLRIAAMRKIYGYEYIPPDGFEDNDG